MSERTYGFATQQLHAGQSADPTTGARAVPIYQTTSFVFKDFATAKAVCSVEEFGYDYSRIGNPTNEVLENRIAALEGGTGALALASGSAATATTILNLTHAGDEVVAAKTLYGGSFNLFVNTLPKHGIRTILVDPADPDNFARAITERTRAIFVETIGNPDINVIDFEAVARIAEAHGLPLIVDNTFGTPYLFRPFDHGANISVHSATKFIGGHGTSIGGLVVDGGNFNWANGKFPDFTTPDPAYAGFVHWDKWGNYPGAGNIAFIIKLRLHYLRDLGASLSPFNAFLFLQGLETLSLRLERQVANTQKIAEWLEARPDVEWVAYPGLRSSPYYALAQKYLPKGAGAILTFGVKGGLDRAKRLIESTKIFSFLANVGDSKSLIVHPATVTHGQLSEAEQRLAGVRPEQVRLSVGTEDIDDLLWDLDQAFAASAP
ncbi:O-acetylhomoserine aminocarboxypropyltransferase/cysteine synthase family protein [Magnetospirillum fulvum]|jgi:O-acetylhomoserine (thiol)-lyase|uniref:O-acetylhomoserine/O-acetylserine sulfhydrylase n=1 Tax=Magnetospirillum fulvum MGU-K5 TaxID=1316936 RepID=S9SFY0_MAGFU|nr:O-acetylhomoserine aminocarboxypropyltransferase/cysteine synthase family protein [Magnetospirillum fulvum]EPY02993.1 O-acetylhomoserine/O-acetylserine sulfhydrylase [Magnetospirillum fulvum MGU-K5]